jgi:hypothetical protein
MPREMTPMYIQDSGFKPPKVEGLLPLFLALHRMMRKTLAPRIGYSEVEGLLTRCSHEASALRRL